MPPNVTIKETAVIENSGWGFTKTFEYEEKRFAASSDHSVEIAQYSWNEIEEDARTRISVYVQLLLHRDAAL